MIQVLYGYSGDVSKLGTLDTSSFFDLTCRV